MIADHNLDAMPLTRWFARVSAVVFAAVFMLVCVCHIEYPGFIEPMEGNSFQVIQTMIKPEAMAQKDRCSTSSAL